VVCPTSFTVDLGPGLGVRWAYWRLQLFIFPTFLI
jgi:hypothetical protein